MAVALEAFLECFELVVERREIESQDDMAIAVRRRVAADVGTAEQGLERVRLVAVVVVVQHRQPAGLAEPAGADQEDVALAFP